MTSNHRITRTAAALALALLAGAARADHLADRRGLTIGGARRAIAAAAEAARTTAGTAAIAVVDEGGNLLAVERLDGTFAAGGPISIGKARTAALFRKPTRFFEQLINEKRTAMVGATDGFTPLIGGVPIEVAGRIVGAIGVSGAASADDDERVALAGAAAIAAGERRAEGVTYFPKDKVAAAFAKGSPLLENGAYKIHASHRDGPGQAEVHAADTDVIHVLQGTATLVTGGDVVDGKATGPEELRGASIRGGETRRLVPGDVVVIPNGVPHQFKEVAGPLDYYVVKVR